MSLYRGKSLHKCFILLVAVAAVVLGCGFGATVARAAERPGAEGVRLVVNGLDMKTDVPPTIVQGRTLVPFRAIGEALGAQVGWEAPIRRVTLSLGERKVAMRIGSRTGRIDGRLEEMDVAPQIVGGRSLVPLRFVGEALGASVSWDGLSKTVTVERAVELKEIRYEAGETKGRLILTTSGPVAFTARPLGVPGVGQAAGSVRLLRNAPGDATRILASSALDPVSGRSGVVVDLSYATVALASPVIPVGQDGVRLVRAAGQTGPVPTAQVLVDLDAPLAWQARTGDEPGQVVLEFGYQLTSVSDLGEAGVLLHTAGRSKPRVTAQDNPHRLLVELPGIEPGTEALRAMDLSGGAATRVLVERLDGPAGDGTAGGGVAGARVTFDLAGPVGYEVVEDPAGVLVRFHNRLRSLAWEEAGGKLLLRLETDVPAPVKVERGAEPGTLVATLGGVRPDLPGGKMPEPSGRVRALRSEEVADPQGMRLLVSMDKPGHYRLAGEGTSRITVEVAAGPLTGRLIAIDPGHGGNDPGAIGPSGTHEKEITLGIATVLKGLLEEAGARVLMTREADQAVGLYERAGMANDAGAELFVSVHVNSSVSRALAGTETYYFPGAAAGRALAQKLQRRMLEALGRTNREVREADFVVVRETRMPSALVECAYLSNQEEERLLQDAAFQRKAAEAISQAVADYLEAAALATPATPPGGTAGSGGAAGAGGGL